MLVAFALLGMFGFYVFRASNRWELVGRISLCWLEAC